MLPLCYADPPFHFELFLFSNQESRSQGEAGEREPAVLGPEVELHAAERQVRTQRGRRSKASRVAAADADEDFDGERTLESRSHQHCR